jgi:hypothetical protein
MTNQYNKLSVGLALLFELILVVTAILSTVSGEWKNVALTMLAMVCLMLPFIITRIADMKMVVLPSGFRIMALVFIFLAQYLGEIRNFYHMLWWWDLLLHAIFGSYAVITALHIIKGIIRKERETTTKRFSFFAVIFAFSFSITLGTLWEVFEFTGDYLLKTNMIKGGLEDTATDLIVKILAAFTTSVIGYYCFIKPKNFYH